MIPLMTCAECKEHFAIYDYVPVISAPTLCSYHTDFTGRRASEARLTSEWLGQKAFTLI